ncbi:hypothetical protein MINTM001_03510 [Mycobacterium paraintracellulare]|uniref:SDR family NAD(P)-dependent oxidoreductase n=1 Tax=Mycobacterium paraintracellulare TaxID=1138383 RepID=UPI001927BA0D|nr:SDR family NAD(P)-dependent oxidoreductase [Mycobacterium paraintracellulare]BCO39212.1 hypothetical protein MINTM001_03510 [Mycobacterium paraintracellulare]
MTKTKTKIATDMPAHNRTIDQLFRLTDRVALVTASTRGLGRAMAGGFAAAGAKPVLASRKPEAVKAAEYELREHGFDVLGVVAHMGDLDQVPALVDRTVDHFGDIDIVVNNAATPLTLRVGQHTPEAWAKSYDVVVDVLTPASPAS